MTPSATSGSSSTCALTTWPAARSAGSTSGRYSSPWALSGRSVSSARSSAAPSNAKIELLISWIASSLVGRIAGGLRLDDALDVAVGVAHDAAVAGRIGEDHGRHRGGRAAVGVGLHELGDRRRGDERPVARRARRRQRSASISPAAAWTAPPVPFWTGWMTDLTPSGSWPASVFSGESTITTLLAPASSAAAIGQPTSGRPQSGCSIFGSCERIRVPWPAARMTAVSAGMGPS